MFQMSRNEIECSHIGNVNFGIVYFKKNECGEMNN